MLSEAAASILSLLPLAAAEPAGGAEATQVAIATAGAALASTALLGLAMGHRSGRVQVLGAHRGRAPSASRACPAGPPCPPRIAAVALNVALLGMYWDISLHIDNGRDAGPLANPAHYLILAGLFGVFAAGVLAIVLPDRSGPGPGAVRIARDWYAPAGGVLMAACGAFSLIAFPLDDVWHRLFGQDVTLWGPTHLMLIGGAGLSLVGAGRAARRGHARAARAAPGAPRPRRPRCRLRPEHVTAARRVGLMGGLLIGLSTFQAEFDFGVPQYRLVFQPLLIALAAGCALVAARHLDRPRRRARRGAVLPRLRGGVSLLVGPVFGQTTPSLPLYLGEALCVERWRSCSRGGRCRSAPRAESRSAPSGLASEWGWSQFAMRLPWSADLLPEAIVFAVAAGVAGGVAGALLALGPARRAAAARRSRAPRSCSAHRRRRRARRGGPADRGARRARAPSVALDPVRGGEARARRRDRARRAALARRRPRLGDRHRLAGRRPARRPALRASRRACYRTNDADPGARIVEVARARALRAAPCSARPSTCPPTPRSRPPEIPAAPRFTPAAAARHRGAAARARLRRPGLAVGRRDRARAGALPAAAGRAVVGSRPDRAHAATARPGSARRAARSRPRSRASSRPAGPAPRWS